MTSSQTGISSATGETTCQACSSAVKASPATTAEGKATALACPSLQGTFLTLGPNLCLFHAAQKLFHFYYCKLSAP